MNRPHALLGASLLTVLATGGIAVAAAGPSTSTVNAPFGAETWYEPNPTCSTPVVGCLPVALPAANPYGAGTLHVGVTAGVTTATSYLTLAPFTAPAGMRLTGAAIVVPLDTATTGNGSMAPDTATVGVCTDIVGGIKAAEGEFDAPPPTDCSSEAPLTYAATPAPQLSGDLASIVPNLVDGYSFNSLALALVPDNPSKTASWNVVFSSNDRANPPTPPASVTLTYSSGSGATATVTTPATVAPAASKAAVPIPARTGATSAPAAAGSGAGRATASSVPPASTAVVAAAPPAAVSGPAAVSAPAPVSAAPGVAAPEVAAGQVTTAAGGAAGSVDAAPASFVVTRHYRFAYPTVLLLPAILLALGIGIARSMTGDVTPRRR